MDFKFTKYGLINALWSLIPIFPIWSLFPGVGLAELLNLILNDCQLSYKITYRFSYIIALLAVLIYINKRKELPSNKENWDFKIWCLFIYTFVNIALFILFIGPEIACTGDGQTIFGIIYSAPISSLSIIVFGLIADITNKRGKV